MAHPGEQIVLKRGLGLIERSRFTLVTMPAIGSTYTVIDQNQRKSAGVLAPAFS